MFKGRKKHNLNENAVGLRNGFEEIIGGPFNCDQRVLQLRRRHVLSEFDNAPRKHCGGEGHRETELDVIAGVVVAAGEVCVVRPPIAQPGVAPPRHPLLRRQVAGALALEEQYALGQCVGVVMVTGFRYRQSAEKQSCEEKNEKPKRHN